MSNVRLAVLPVADANAEVALARAEAAFKELAPFRVELAATELPPVLDWTFARAKASIGARSLVVTGPAEWVRHTVSPPLAEAVGLGRIGASITEDRMQWLSEALVALCPQVTAVILPLANHMAFPAAEFAADAGDYLGSRNPGPLWLYPRISGDHDAAIVETVGLPALGLPDLAFPVGARAPADATNLSYQLARMLVGSGPAPIGATVNSASGALRLDAILPTVQWWAPADPQSAQAAVARSRLARRRAFGVLLGAHTHFHTPSSAATVAKEHFYSRRGSVALTNGVSDRAQPGGSPEQRNTRVEFLLGSPALGPWANGWLEWAAQSFHGHDPSTPFHEFDRLALPKPAGGIAGAVLWPTGDLSPGGEPVVQLWRLLPITVDELEHFRRDGAAHAAWVRERQVRDDVPLIEQRWAAG